MLRRTLVGLIGSNIQNSLSPALHEDAFEAAGIHGHYHLMDLDVLGKTDLRAMLQSVRRVGFAGVNVTHPYKEAVIPFLDALSSEARQIGAVNTVVIGKDSSTVGHNTDRIGFRRAFIEEFGEKLAERSVVLLLGAGGAGRAVAFALIDLGAEAIFIYDKDKSRGVALCADIEGLAPGRSKAVGNLADVAGSAAGIVNATPIGMLDYPGVPIAPELISEAHWAADIIYTPLETLFIATARAKGSRVMCGGSMCVHQAAEAFRHFTGTAPDITRLHRVFAAACSAREIGRSAPQKIVSPDNLEEAAP
jgi:shikimate dehydrogenase